MSYISHYSKWHNHNDPVYVEYMIRKFEKAFGDYLPINKEAEILEIGCANGMALFALKRFGYTNTTGIEFNSELVDIARSFSLNIINSDAIEYVTKTNKKFDFIYLFDVLEHFDVTQISVFLMNVYKLLNENGKLMLITPNATSPAGSYFRYIDWTHQTSFTPTSISYLLEEAGFRSITVMDDSLIKEAKREDFEYEESYNKAKIQSDRARLYESFARWEMSSMFGSSPYNLLIAPNMKVVAVKDSSISLVDLKVISDDNIFDFGQLVNDVDELRAAVGELRTDVQTTSQRMKNELFTVVNIVDGVQAMQDKLTAEVNNSNNTLNNIILELNYSNKIQSNTVLLNLYKYNMNRKQKSLLWKIKFKFKYKKQKRLIEDSELFDIDYYITKYPDVKASGIEPIYHYLCFGAYEGRNPSSEFLTDEYIISNPELNITYINPLIHFIKR